MLHTGWISFLALSCFMWFIIWYGYLNAICSLIYSFIFSLTQLHCLPISYELSLWVSTQGFCPESYIIVTSGSIVFKVKALITAHHLYSISDPLEMFLLFLCMVILFVFLFFSLISLNGYLQHRWWIKA